MALGWKDVETRSWPTAVRGEVAIHAACTTAGFKQVDEADWPTKSLFAHVLGVPFDRWASELPRGVIVAKGNLVDCRATEEWRKELLGQLAYGDFSDGRFGHLYEDLQPVRSLRVRGYQGFFNVNRSVLL